MIFNAINTLQVAEITNAVTETSWVNSPWIVTGCDGNIDGNPSTVATVDLALASKYNMETYQQLVTLSTSVSLIVNNISFCFHNGIESIVPAMS